MKSGLPELLAPAGNLQCALTAFHHGADAVYAGLGRFNAREMGENFSYDDMARLSARAKQAGKKIYITLNTLIKEGEFSDFTKTLSSVAGLEPDGIIVQDLGVSAFIRDAYPEIPIHASTQMGFHNSAGLEVAAGLGIERVILERQITLEELRILAKNPPVELEVFIHGALCCSLSGQCLFSSWIGGWSGNRGKCKQPCRRRYYGSDGAGFYFSTQDLYSLDLLYEYIALGIRSLKIEGRLKKPDYVASVVRAYRMVLDSGGRDDGVIREARDILSRSFGRRWSHGFSSVEDFQAVIQHDSIGVSGQLIGRLLSARSGGVHVRLNRPLYCGDRVRVQPDSGDEGPAFTVSSILTGGKSVRSAGKGSEVMLPCDGEVPAGGNLYRIGVHTSPPGAPENIPLFLPRKPLYLSAGVRRTGIEIRVMNIAGNPVFSMDLDLDEAERHPLTPGDLRQALKQTKHDDFLIRLGEVRLEGKVFLPAVEMKTIRKAFREWLESLLRSREPDRFSFPVLPREGGVGRKYPPDLRDACLSAGKRGCSPTAYRLGGLFDDPCGLDEMILPSFCAEGDLEDMKRRIARVYKAGIRRFRLTSLFQFGLFGSCPDAVLIAAYPLPAVNARGMKELASLGVSRIQGWIELGTADLADLRRLCPVDFEVYLKGRPPILVTRAYVAVSGAFTDSRGKNFFAEYDGKNRLTFVYPGEAMEIRRIKGASAFIDTRHPLRSGEKVTDFNASRGLT